MTGSKTEVSRDFVTLICSMDEEGGFESDDAYE